MRLISRFGVIVCLAGIFLSATDANAASGCVYRVIGPAGGVLYLGGSWHSLRSVDYPLPATYNMAFDAANRLAFEIAPKDLENMSKALPHAAEYPRGDSLKNHVDPRTYDYLRRFFSLRNVTEDKFARYRPWFLAMSLRSGGGEFSGRLGVEMFFERRAATNSKPVTGLESLKEHIEVFSGLSDRSGEALLLITLIPTDKATPDFDRMIKAWRAGNADFLANAVHAGFHDFPAMADRLLGMRNRNWVPKLEQFMRSGKTYFVIVGAGHLGGADGLVALLKARGCQIQQL